MSLEAERIIDEKPLIKFKKMRIVYDGKQYNIRIPQKFAKSLKLLSGRELAKLKFNFTLTIPPVKDQKKEKPQLRGELSYD